MKKKNTWVPESAHENMIASWPSNLEIKVSLRKRSCYIGANALILTCTAGNEIEPYTNSVSLVH